MDEAKIEKVNEILERIPIRKRECALCGYNLPEAIEEHHICYDPPFTMLLCANCHRIVTRVDRNEGFYDYERCRDIILKYRQSRDVIWQEFPPPKKRSRI